MLTEYIITKALDEIYQTCKAAFKESVFQFDTKAKDIEVAISNHLTQINNWSKEISFNGLKKAKLTSQVFIDIDIFLMPQKEKFYSNEEVDKISSKELFGSFDKHLVVLGQPGAGKTTLVKYISQSIMLDETFYPELFTFPIIIRLRDLTVLSQFIAKNPVINGLFSILGLTLKMEEKKKIEEKDILHAKETILFPLLEKLRPLIILDGYDEIPTSRNREKVMDDFQTLVLNLNNARILLTSRSSDYEYSIENTDVIEICPLNADQIKDFSFKWLGDMTLAEIFLKSLRESPYADTIIRPLTLSHLCAIYERVGKIPDKPKTLYKKIINLLLEEWDEQRNVKRPSNYANFEIDRKFDFLCRLAYEITTSFGSSVFDETTLKKIYKNIFNDFGLLKDEGPRVIKELEGHTGLIIQSGYKEFEFAHKSIQEYLCAEYLVKLPVIPSSEKILRLLPNELAITTSISSDSSLYFCELVLNRFISQLPLRSNNVYSSTFITIFTNRLVLEKPDFNLSNDISFALAVLYTLFRRSDHGQIKIFEDDLPKQFEKFVELIFVRNNKFQFEKYYELDETFKNEENKKILKLIKKGKNDFSYNGYYKLPEFLLVRDTFISDLAEF